MRNTAIFLLLCLLLGAVLTACAGDTQPAGADTEPPAISESDSPTTDRPPEASQPEPAEPDTELPEDTETPADTEPPQKSTDEIVKELPDVTNCKDGVVTLFFTQINDDTRERFLSLIGSLSALSEQEIDPAKYNKIVVGNATLEIAYGSVPSLVSCTAYNNALTFEAGQIPLDSSSVITLYNTASAVLLGSGANRENWCFLTEACSYSLAEAQAQTPRMARTQIRIYTDTEGNLMYTRQPVKFLSEYRKTDADYLRLCAARDELLLETGALSLLPDGTPYFFPIEVAHVSDTVDLDALWAQVHTESEFAVYATLDDRLAANAIQYPAVY